LKLFSDILSLAAPFLRPEPVYDPKAVEKGLRKAGAMDLLREFRSVLEAAELFEPTALEKELKMFCEQRGVGVGKLVQPLRVATTGVDGGFGLYEGLAILGRDEALRRIDFALRLV